MNFNWIVTKTEWQEKEGKWKVNLKNTKTDEVKIEECDILLGAHGLLNRWKWPSDIKNLSKFKGKLVHTARWPDNYGPKEWENDRVVIIGSGASSVQTVPTMQPHTKKMDIFIRTPIWFTTIAGNSGDNFEYTEEQKHTFRTNHDELIKTARKIEGELNGGLMLKSFMTNSVESQMAKELYTTRMREHIPDDKLFKALLPTFTPGCRRITPGNPYMAAVQKDNVDVHTCAVVEATEDGIIGADGVEVKCDTVVCATGFDVSYVPPFEMVGRNGVSLQQKWSKVPEGYLGLAVPDMPNYFTFIGPTWPVENGSVMGPLEQVSKYVIQIINKMQVEKIHSLEPKHDVTALFNDHAQAWVNGTCWEEDCRSWYKNNETGRVNAVWPGSSLHYNKTIETPRYEDFNIKYSNEKNMWAYLGLGFIPNQVEEGGDLAPYINKDELEPSFFDFRFDPKEEEELIKARGSKVYGGAANQFQ